MRLRIAGLFTDGEASQMIAILASIRQNAEGFGNAIE
jgi:hypothetical protein